TICRENESFLVFKQNSYHIELAAFYIFSILLLRKVDCVIGKPVTSLHAVHYCSRLNAASHLDRQVERERHIVLVVLPAVGKRDNMHKQDINEVYKR
ncbi:unnamed protein product, partial [Larinioides sclopetarius]